MTLPAANRNSARVYWPFFQSFEEKPCGPDFSIWTETSPSKIHTSPSPKGNGSAQRRI